MRRQLRRHDWLKTDEVARPAPVQQVDHFTQGCIYNVVTISTVPTLRSPPSERVGCQKLLQIHLGD
jgi:hypothetical protein